MSLKKMFDILLYFFKILIVLFKLEGREKTIIYALRYKLSRKKFYIPCYLYRFIRREMNAYH